MQLTEEQFSKIEPHFPKSRGTVKISNLVVINALLHIMHQGHSWCALPKSYGPWHTIYMRFNRWSKNGVLERVYKALQEEGFVPQTTRFAGLDSKSVSVHKRCTSTKKTRQTVHRHQSWRTHDKDTPGYRGRACAAVLDALGRQSP